MIISDVMEYKSKITEQIIKIPDVFTLINNKDISKPSDMINKNLFSYMKVPNSALTVKNYICFDYNSKIFSRNEVLKHSIINIGIVCHEDNIKTAWGNRHDVLSGVIIDSFNWSKFLGFELELISDTESILQDVYHIRTLQFKNLTPNSLENGVKMDGF